MVAALAGWQSAGDGLCAGVGGATVPSMPGEPPSGSAAPALDDLERRLAAFESATRRLTRTVGSVAPPSTGGGLPPADPAADGGSSGSREAKPLAAPAGDISSLRPAVAVAAPVTGALTARERRGGTARTGFTSVHGRPNVSPARIPEAPGQGASPAAPATAFPSPRRRIWRRWVLAACAAALMALALALPRLFVVCPDGAVVAPSRTVTAPGFGVLAPGAAAIGQTVAAGQVLAAITTPPATGLDKPGTSIDVVSPVAGAVRARAVSPGQQVQPGQVLYRIALPAEPTVVASLPSAATGRVAPGDRVEVLLIGESRTVDGTVRRILEPGAREEGIEEQRGDSRGLLLIELDPAGRQPLLGQGARVTVIGPRPGPLRLALLRLRGMLPW